MTVSPLSQKMLTVSQAVDLVRDGDSIIVPTAAGEPPTLLHELSRRRRDFRDVAVSQVLALHRFDYFDPATAHHVRHQAFFLGTGSRTGGQAGYVEVIPTHFSTIPDLLRRGLVPADVVMGLCSPADDEGYVYLGLSADYTMAAMESARVIILEVNEAVPQARGECRIDQAKVTAFVTSEHPVPEVGLPEIGPVQRAIGGHVADLVPDGATVQIGFGAIPDAVVVQLTDKTDLGIHTEVLGDGLLALIDAGVVTNERKVTHRGVTVATFVLGSRRLYDYVHRNDRVHVMPVDIVNDPYLAGRNDALHAINGSLQVDLIGQCASESLGWVPYSGTGGQTDFVRAANRSRGGKSIIVLPATAKQGTVSRIAPVLAPGAHQTTSKNDTDFVVTEYGVAQLRGKTVSQRAKALIGIAHPDFREELSRAAREMNLIT